MRFFRTVFLALPTVLASLTAEAAVLRRFTVEQGGDITEPVAGTTVSPGETFDFNYAVRNFCHAGYSPVTIWLLANPPTNDDVVLNDNGVAVINSTSLHFFGSFLAPNFGLPPMSTPVPPSSLTMPDLSVGDEEVYLTVVETYFGCPPDGHTDAGLTSSPIEYDGSN